MKADLVTSNSVPWDHLEKVPLRLRPPGMQGRKTRNSKGLGGMEIENQGDRKSGEFMPFSRGQLRLSAS